MIISRITGGIGNQMFQYACSKLLSPEDVIDKATKNLIKHDWYIF